MTTGLSGTYAFNNTNLTLPPSEGKWVERTSYGVDGNAHTVYSQFRNFELSWDLISTADAKQIIDIYNQFGTTGTVISCLPKWGDSSFTFYNYTGTTLQEPTFDSFFQGYYQTGKLLIVNVKTN